MRGVVFLNQLSTFEKERREQLPLNYHINKERFSLQNLLNKEEDSYSNQPQVVLGAEEVCHLFPPPNEEE